MRWCFGAGDVKGGRGTTMVYDIPSNSWAYNEAALNVPRSDACMAQIGGKLYIGGAHCAMLRLEFSVVALLQLR